MNTLLKWFSCPLAVSATFATLAVLYACDGSSRGAFANRISLLREDFDVASIDFSPDGQRLATAAALGTEVRIWTWKPGKKVERTLQIPAGLGPGTRQGGLRFSRDGGLLAIAHGRARESEGFAVVRIWNTQTGAIVGEISEPRGGGDIGRVEFTPSGDGLLRSYGRISTVAGDSLLMHQMNSWKSAWGIRTNPFIPDSLAVSPDGKFAALGGEVLEGNEMRSQIVVVDLQSRAISVVIDAIWRGISIEQIAWSADGARIAVGASLNDAQAGEPAIRIFEVKSKKQTTEQTMGSCEIRGLAFTADGKYLLQGGRRAHVEVWDASHSEMLQSIPVSADAISLSPDGHHFAVVEGSKISIWELH